MRVRQENYLVIDYNKFSEDVKRANIAIGDKVSISSRLRNAGLNEGAVCNAKNNARFGYGIRDIREYEYCECYGVIQKVHMTVICGLFNLNADDYILHKRRTGTENTDYIAEYTTGDYEDTVSNLKNEIQNMLEGIQNLNGSINKIGAIQAQSMEYLRDIAEGIQQLNDKWK